MTTPAFLLILFSGLMHALYNLLIKSSRDKTVFIWWIFVCSTLLFTAALPFLPGKFPPPGSTVVFLAGGGAFCFVLYHLFTGRAYGSGDLSVTYPLSQTSMLYVPLWGVWLLCERITLTGFCGVFLIAGGTYLVQVGKLDVKGLVRPAGTLVNDSVKAALAAGFVYSLGAVIDKTSLRLFPPLYFTYVLVVSMLALMTINLLRPCYRGRIVREWRESRQMIVVGGPLMMGSFLSFRYGLALAPMSYAVPLRQVSVPIGVIMGTIFLGEACGRIRLLAALLIVIGVFLIRLG
jgi:drug/metabolite transporter (DMT)-like permease